MRPSLSGIAWSQLSTQAAATAAFSISLKPPGVPVFHAANRQDHCLYSRALLFVFILLLLLLFLFHAFKYTLNTRVRGVDTWQR